MKPKKVDELVSTARFADKTYHKYKLIMLYDGSQIAEYDMSSGDRGSKADSKSPRIMGKNEYDLFDSTQ